MRISALVLEGLHFDVLLGTSWVKKPNATLHASEKIV